MTHGCSLSRKAMLIKARYMQYAYSLLYSNEIPLINGHTIPFAMNSVLIDIHHHQTAAQLPRQMW